MGGKACKQYDWHGISLKNTQAAPIAQYWNNKQSNQKNGQEVYIDISPKKTYRQARGTEKPLSITIREMQIKTAVRYHLALVRMAIIRKSRNSKCWGESGGKGTHLHCSWKGKLVQPLQKTVWKFLKKPKVEVPYDSAVPLLGIYLEKTIICTYLSQKTEKRWENHNLKCAIQSS